MYKSRAEELLDNIQTNIECPPATQDISLNLANRKICVDKANLGIKTTKAEDEDFTEIEDTEVETPEMEIMEYKKDFYDMSVGSIKAIMTHAQNILDSLDNPSVKENLTESWLQGKIAVTEDYMRTIHDFIMYVSEAADTISAADKPGLWENIRKKKERMGKKYKPAKPGDNDRPDPEQWKKLTK